MLQERPPELSIIFSGSTNSRGLPTEEVIENGSSVSLKTVGTSILVHNIRHIAESGYSGEIYGFEHATTTQIDQYRIGDTIKFSYKNIFACTRN